MLTMALLWLQVREITGRCVHLRVYPQGAGRMIGLGVRLLMCCAFLWSCEKYDWTVKYGGVFCFLLSLAGSLKRRVE
jgi:hypothetical protein